MQNPSPGWTLGSYTTVSANGIVLTPTSKLIFDGNVGYTKYWGPGTEGIAQTESNRVGLPAHYETWGKNKDDLEYLDGSFRRSSLLTAVLGDLGVLSNVHGDIDQGMIRGGSSAACRRLTPSPFRQARRSRPTVRQAREYNIPSPLPPRPGATGSTRSRLWRSTRSSSIWLTIRIPSENLMLWRNTAGFETALSSVLSYGANLGVILYAIENLMHRHSCRTRRATADVCRRIYRRLHRGRTRHLSRYEGHNAQPVRQAGGCAGHYRSTDENQHAPRRCNPDPRRAVERDHRR